VCAEQQPSLPSFFFFPIKTVYIKVTWKKVFDYVNFEKDADQGR
jgi:hypothetical protein